MSLVGEKAPDFVAPAVMPDNSFKENFHFAEFVLEKYAVLFFYPGDFTFVCPTEILAFSHRLDDFASRDCVIAAVSTDSHFTHLAWKSTPVERGGLGAVRFPLVADVTKKISASYDVLKGDEIVVDNSGRRHHLLGGSVALRGLFLLDRQMVIRHQVVNDAPLGRSVDETLRVLDALRHFKEHGEVCPVNWRPGQAGIEATPEGIAEFLHQYGESL